MSSLFLRTLREDPADAEVPSHKLLVRAGYVRRVAPGVYSWLPLGLKVLRRIENVVREEMDAMLQSWTVMVNQVVAWTTPRVGALIGVDVGARFF